MPFVWAGLLSLAIAWVRGASPLTLGRVQLRLIALPVVSFAVQLLAFVLFPEHFGAFALWAQVLAGGALLAFLVANAHYRSLLLVALGTLLNLAVITANGGHMPVRVADLVAAGRPDIAQRLAEARVYQKSVVMDEHTRLAPLADVIVLPAPGPDRLMSFGDVLVGIGAFWFIQEALVAGQGGARRRSNVRPILS